MTRLSLLQTFNQGLRGILNVQTQLYKTQNQIATGSKVNQPSDDPVAAAKILAVEDELSRLTQYQKNIDGAENSLTLEDTQLDAVNSLLTRVRELAIQAGDGALSSNDRSAITAEVRTRLDELLALANTRNTAGEYIFGGYKGEQAPFVLNGTSYQYVGDDGQRMLQVSSSTYVAMGDNGSRIFEAIPQANVAVAADPANTSDATISRGRIVDVAAFEATFTGPADTYQIAITNFTAPDQYTYDVLDSGGATVVTGATFTANEPFTFGGTEFRIVGTPPGTSPIVGDSFDLTPPSTQSVLTTVSRLAEGLGSLGDSPEDLLRLQDLIGETLDNLTNAETNVSTVRAQVGARLNTLDSTRDLHQGTELVSNKVMSEVRDLDYAEALSRLTQENFILQAAQQSFAKISQMSLFNFLR